MCSKYKHKNVFISILYIYKWIRLVNKVKAECVPKRMNYQQQNKWKQEAIEIEWLGGFKFMACGGNRWTCQ